MSITQSFSCHANALAQQFHLMTEQVEGYAVLLLSPEGIITSWNRGAEKIKGYAAQEAIGRHFRCLYNDEDQQRGAPEQDLEQACVLGHLEEEAWRRHKDGYLFRARITLLALHDERHRLRGFAQLTLDLGVRNALAGRGEELMRMLAIPDAEGSRQTTHNAPPDDDGVGRVMASIFQDVQMLKDTLASERERALVTLRLLNECVIITDAAGCIDYMNPAAERMTGWTLAEALGKRAAALLRFCGGQAPGDPDLVGDCLRNKDKSTSFLHGLLRSRAGREFAVDASITQINLSDGRLAGAVLALRDVTEAHSLLRALAHQASHDALTGLINRREFETRLQRALDQARSGAGTGALIYLDLDQFKIVNDTCGHATGDDLLQQLAHSYQSVVRERDTFARLGGDEFALIIEHCTVEEASYVANKLLETTTAFKYPYCDRTFRVGASIGVVPIGASAMSIEQMMRLADHACYLAKENGRNRIYVHKDNDAALARRQSDMHWVSRLNEALRDDNLELFYQPIAPMGAKEGLLHYEILLRLKDRDGRHIGPASFLPAAERFDLMPAVDRWVLKRVLAWLEGQPEHVARLDIATINLSRRTLADESFQQYAIACLENSSVPPHKLCFEITENGAIANPAKTIKFIETLKERGCRFSLDDFGTGMTSFSYLKLLPVDFIKIDGSFVTMMKDSAVDREMVRFTNEISHIMGRRTIAEYVGDAGTYESLRELQIDYAQGYWIGMPRPLEAKMLQ